MPAYCDKCAKATAPSDNVFTNSGGVICSDCQETTLGSARRLLDKAEEIYGNGDIDELIIDSVTDLLILGKKTHHLNPEKLLSSVRLHLDAELEE